MKRAVIVLTVLFVLAGAVARADETADRARGKTVWSEGITRYDLGDFDEAVRKFEEAYTAYPNPNILFNLGQAYRQKKVYERSVFYFHAYLRNKPEAPNRDVVEQLIAELEGLIAAQKASSKKPPTEIQPPAPGPAPPPPAPPRRWYEDRVGWAVAGGGAVALGVGVGFLIRAGGLSSDAGSAVDQDAARGLVDSARRAQIVGATLAGIGAAAIVAGAVKMALYERPGGEPRVAIAVGPRWLGLAGKW
jgi:tetratricopeptide (TPR) repeat protein